MEQFYETVETVKHRRVLCDECGVEIGSLYGELFSCELYFTLGDSWPDCGYEAKKQSIDLCKNCAPKAFDAMRAAGLKVRSEDISG